MARAADIAEKLRLAENALAAGSFAEAVHVLRHAVRLDHDSPRPALMLGYALSQSGAGEEAVRVLRRLIERFPSNSDAWLNLGNLLRRQRRLEEAVRAYRRAAVLRPDDPTPAINLSYTLSHQGNFTGAEAELRTALARFPNEPELLVNLAQAQRATRRWADAIATLDRCIALAPGHAGYRVTRAIALQESGDAGRALGELNALLSAAPELADGRFARAGMRLSSKDWDGWEDYLWRPDRLRWLAAQARPVTERPAGLADLRGRDVLLIGEQGLGDVLFFLRFAPLLAPMVRRLGAEVDARLAAILPGDLVAKHEGTDASYRLLCGDLPFILERSPAPPLALAASPERRAAFSARLGHCGPPPYIGVSWQGGMAWRDMAGPGAGLFKRVAPAELGRSLRSVPATLVSLQRDAPAGDLETISSAASRPVHDFSPVNQSLPDAVALLAALDEYIAVSNTNVHLNESVGRRSRVLVTHPAEWRWTDEERSPWFPNAVLYRQDRNGSWSSALEALEKDLQRG